MVKPDKSQLMYVCNYMRPKCFNSKEARGIRETNAAVQWKVPQVSIMIIYNSTWSILIQCIRDILSGDNLTYLIQKKAYFLIVMNLITRTKGYYRMGRSLKMCGTMHCLALTQFPQQTYVPKILMCAKVTGN